MAAQGCIPIRAKENLKDMVDESRPFRPSQAANARNILDTPSRQIPDTAAEAIGSWMAIYKNSSQVTREDSELYDSEESTVIAVVEKAQYSFRPHNDATNQVMSKKLYRKLYRKVASWMEKQGEEYEDHNSTPAPGQGVEWGKDLPEMRPKDGIQLAKIHKDKTADVVCRRVDDTDWHILGLEKLQGEYDRSRIGLTL